jgi:hypothetical protein
MSLVETDKIQEKVALVMRQTDYNEEVALEKLKLHDFNEILVIKEYLGVPIKKVATPVKSVNQEIYRQLRTKLDSNMRDYQVRVEKGEAKKII